MKKVLLTFFMLTLIIILGCNEKNQDAILENDGTLVILDCIMPNECTDQHFNDLESFQVFDSAVDSAVKMQGLINYGAEYNLQITFQDQTTKAFQLSLGTKRDMKGLLVNLNNTNQGYAIPVTYANKLRDWIKSTTNETTTIEVNNLESKDKKGNDPIKS